MKYVPALDGLRAVAVLLVIAVHARTPFVSGGFLGVDMFFVLSGFLITSLLLAEIRDTDKITLWPFYLRRLRRLMPALLLLLALYAGVAPFLWPESPHHLRDIIVSALYLSDYSMALFNIPGMALSHTWSLSVEEHYYLVWPFLLLWAVRRSPDRRLVWVLFAFYLGATLWRWLCVGMGRGNPAVFFSFDTRLSGLMLGGVMAAAFHHGTIIQKNLKPYAAHLAILGCLAATAALSTMGSLALMLTFGVFFCEIGVFIAMLEIMGREKSPIRDILSQKPLVFLGRISYGLYLYHAPVVVYLNAHYDWRVALPLGFAVTLALATVSYYGVERRFLNGRRNGST